MIIILILLTSINTDLDISYGSNDNECNYDCEEETETETEGEVKWYNRGKGEMLDEFYIRLEENDRNKAKLEVKRKLNKYNCNFKDLKFAKPRKGKSGIYALMLNSDKYWYDRFYKTIDTYCLCCHKYIVGKLADFPRADYNISEDAKDNFYCSYECKRTIENKLKSNEGEFQERETPEGVVGYIYHMYNRKENKHYIGQTKYLPFFRWQEHIKSGLKGNICDITFEVLTEVNKYYKHDDDKNREYMNNIEAWWIQKFKEEGYNVMNEVTPRLTISSLKEAFNEFVHKEKLNTIVND